ncbi:MAG: type II toxin-antitoxin system VapC family toxin [Prosthecobacter sp.]|nr:type II toxin-antitoxin system VapC family toxin [Prosthecobacter sp.]
MFLLDTNHLRELIGGTKLGDRLRQWISEADADVVTSIINADECLRGWLALIAGADSPERETMAYERLNVMIDLLNDLVRLPYDNDAAQRFATMRKSGIRIGSKDLKIACIALEYNATVLTRNGADFNRVPGLKIENWLD